MDECALICATHGRMLEEHYGPKENPRKAGRIAGAMAAHQSRFPDCVLRIEREPLEDADARRAEAEQRERQQIQQTVAEAQERDRRRGLEYREREKAAGRAP